MLIINIAHQEYSEALDHIIHAIPDMKDIQCTIEFSADHSQSKIIRDFVGKIFDTHHIRAIWRGRFILITDELVNNAIEHGSAHDDLDTCIIHAGLSEK